VKGWSSAETSSNACARITTAITPVGSAAAQVCMSVIDLIRAHGLWRTLAETAAFLFILGSFYVAVVAWNG
jgi:hypothetical protein